MYEGGREVERDTDTDGQTDRPTDRRTDGRTDGQTDTHKHAPQTYGHRLTNSRLFVHRFKEDFVSVLSQKIGDISVEVSDTTANGRELILFLVGGEQRE